MTYSEAFEVLGLSSDASIEQVAARFKVLAKKYHPDRHWDADPKRQRFLAKKFAEANTAYEKALEFLATPSEKNPDHETEFVKPGSVPPSTDTPPVKSGWKGFSVFVALCLSLIAYGQVDTKRGKTQKLRDAQSCASTPYSINKTISLAKEALKENDYALALNILNTRRNTQADAESDSLAWREFLEVRYTANCGMVALAEQKGAISHGWALHSQGVTLHMAMKHKIRGGFSAEGLHTLSASCYKKAVDIALLELEADSGNTRAARLAAVALRTLGNLHLEFDRSARNDEYLQEATDCFARSVDLCTQYPTVADVMF